jgi:hypothetical protein
VTDHQVRAPQRGAIQVCCAVRIAALQAAGHFGTQTQAAGLG